MTLRQKKAIKNVVENGGNITKAMIAAGYSPASANNPSVLTRTEAWQKIIDEKLKDDLLVQKHREALEATKWNDFTGEREEDHTTRLKAVELGYKLKKKLGPETMNQFNAGGDMTLEFTQ